MIIQIITSILLAVCLVGCGARVHPGLNKEGTRFTRESVSGSVSLKEMQTVEEGDRKGEQSEAEKINMIELEYQLNVAYKEGDDGQIDRLLRRKANAAASNIAFMQTAKILRIVNGTPWRGIVIDGPMAGTRLYPNQTTQVDQRIEIGEGQTFHVRNLDTGRVMPITRNISEDTDEIRIHVRRLD
jgi:hypothetical protein